MSNTVYPIASVQCNFGPLHSLPRIDTRTEQVEPPRFFIGLFWAVGIEAGVGLAGWLLWFLCR